MLRKVWDEITYPFPNFNGYANIYTQDNKC